MLDKLKRVSPLFIAIVLLASVIRLWHLADNPPSLYWEEAALGYDAYSILKTGKDYHGHWFPVVAFESFGDWKPSLYFYSIVPSIAVFGLTEWSVRLPSAIAGIVIVIAMGWLVRLLVKIDQPKITPSKLMRYQMIAMAVTAISPWAIIFSRGAWEANLATCLILLGVVAFIRGIQLDLRTRLTTRVSLSWMMVGVLSLVLSMYTYHSARVIAPVVGVSLGCSWWWLWVTSAGNKTKKKLWYFWQLKWQVFAMLGIAGLVLLLPIALSLNSIETQQRFNETNIFADLSLLQKGQQLQAAAGDGWLARIFYHRYLIYFQEILKNIFAQLDLGFLFITGDENARHSIRFMGQLYHVELVFWLVGLFALWKKFRRWAPLLLGWLGVGLVTISITKAVPHALRLLPTLPVWLTLITFGVYQVYEWCSAWLARILPRQLQRASQLVVVAVLVLAYLAEFVFFWRFYTTIYPKEYAGAFQDGYQQMIEEVVKLSERSPDMPVFITREDGRPAIYYWFFTQTDPRQVQAFEAQAQKDQGEFLNYDHLNFPSSPAEITRPAIVAITPRSYEQLVGKEVAAETDSEVTIIRNVAGQPVWLVFIYE